MRCANWLRRSLQCAILSMGLSMGCLAYADVWMPPPGLPDLDVEDQDGRPLRFYRDVLQGRTVLINFMFTACTTACPAQTAILRDVRQRWSDSLSPQEEVLFVSVTVDPIHDGPQQLREYAQRHAIATGLRHGWVFLTGETREIGLLLTALNSATARPADHSNFLWIGNEPRQRWTRTAAFNTPQHFTHLLQEIVQ